MSEQSETAQRQPAPVEGRSTGEILRALLQYNGPPEQFLGGLLALQCRIGAAKQGAVFRVEQESQIRVLASYPPLAENEAPPAWMNQATQHFREAFQSARTTVKAFHAPDDLYGGGPRKHLVFIPLGANVPVIAVFMVETQEQAVLAAARERLEMTIGFLNIYEMRLALIKRQGDLERLRQSIEILPAVNEHDKFIAAAMAFCNEAASKWKCERASLGFLKGRYVHLRAMSHTEKFTRKMKVVQDLEAAMEECLDQDMEVLVPTTEGTAAITRATSDLAKRHGLSNVLSLPMRRGGEVVAVLTLERPGDQKFTPAEIESVRLACELSAARLVNLHEHDRWFGARMANSARKALAAGLGPKHTWKKVIAVAVLAAIIFLVVAKGKYTADATFVLEAVERQVVPAPFEGELEDVLVEPGDAVKGGQTVLATLRTDKLKYELAAAKGELAYYQKQASSAMSQDKRAEAQMALAQADSVSAQISLLEYQIRQATIIAPISGRIISGDLKKQGKAPVKTGVTLFEVAPLDTLRAELAVPEDQITEVKDSQGGELATAAYPERKFKFIVERVNPVAEVVAQKNVFKVRVRLVETEPWMRPGMEGLAKVEIGRRHYAWIWTHRIVDWIRMRLWI